MGDIADDLTEQGQDAWLRHVTGNCGDDYCQYCHEDDVRRTKQRAKERQRRRKARKSK